MKDRRIFVSGGAGVIGSELILKLAKAGATVMVGDLKPRPDDWPAMIIYRQGDLNYITKEEIELFEPQVFIHLAATFERSVESYEFWKDNFWHNVRLSNHLMSLLRDSTTLERVIFASSYLIYDPTLYSFPEPQALPIALKETDPVRPRNLTGCAKLQHEVELDFLSGFRSDQFTSVCARIFRGYGKGSRCVISRWIRELLAGKAIEIYRKEGRFDFIYSEETANGLIKLIEHPEITGVINLGSGRARAINEVVAILKQNFPRSEMHECESGIPFEASQADMSRFLENTGWMPQKQLEDAIPLMIDYERTRLDAGADLGNVLISSVSKKVPLVRKVKQSAAKMSTDIRTFGCDMDINCIGRYFTDDFLRVPALSELSFEYVLQLCLERNINAVIPTRDGELQFFANIREKLRRNNINVMISDEKTVSYCLDKLRFYYDRSDKNVPIVATSDKIDNLECSLYVVKERYGSGSHKIGLKLTKERALLHAETLDCPIFQPYIEGYEVSVDAYVDAKGHVKGIISRRRELVAHGESQVTSTTTMPEVDQITKKFLLDHGFYGHVILQIIVGSDSRLNVVECNPRFGGASTLSLEAGLDSFYWFLLESNGTDVSRYPFLPSKKHLRQIRFPVDLVRVL